MKKIFLVLSATYLIISSCQKAISFEEADNINSPGGDTSINNTDSLTYEVLTNDAGGWYGIWNDENNELSGSGLDSGTWGNAIYFKSGWKYSFVPKTKPLNMMLSAATKSYTGDITINFYKNGELLKTITNSPVTGVAKLFVNSNDTLQGTTTNPVITYEVFVDPSDTLQNQYDGWQGGWVTNNNYFSYHDNPLALVFPYPSGWKYTFRPEKIPFNMSMQASSFSDQSKVIINFYVNGTLVKTGITYGLHNNYYEMNYEVQ